MKQEQLSNTCGTRVGLDCGIIEKTFAALAPQLSVLIDRFYEELFRRFPEVRALFRDADMPVQKKHLQKSFAIVVENLRNPKKLTPVLHDLGRRHQKLGARPDHYEAVAATLLEVMEEFAGDQWTVHVNDQWTLALILVSNTMLESYTETNEEDCNMATNAGSKNLDHAADNDAVRMRSAIEGSRTAVMMIDRDMVITYANPATVQLIRSNEGEFRKHFPSFDPNVLIGANVDVFHSNPAHQRRICGDPKNLPYEATIRIGRCVFSLNITGIFDDQGEHTGCCLEWADVTSKLAEREYRNGTISVSDPEVRKRLEFLGLTEDHLGIIATWDDVVRKTVDSLIDTFYEYIENNRETRAIVQEHTTIERQRPLVKRYILSMFSGCIDDEYLEYRRRVGAAHDDIDLDANWYVAMYDVIRRGLLSAVREAGASQAELDRFADALYCLIQVDIALCMGALMGSRRGKIEALKGEVQQRMDEAAGFIAEMGSILTNLSEGDLTTRMTGEYKGDYAEIQSALNTAMDNLSLALEQVAVGAEQVAAAASEISAGSQSLAQGSSEQASSLAEVASELQEMTSMTKQNAANAGEAKSLTDGARVCAERGASSMASLSEAIDRIKASSDETAKIIKTIDEIAFQTNLLALNAAVEAARAGDAGKGFAVVAEEVRNLAMRSAEAAKNTANMIEGSVKNAENGVNLNQEVQKNLKEINDQVQKVGTVMAEIAAASDQQSLGIEKINVAIEQMNQVTQQTAANSEESASASEELSGQAEEMKGMVGSFKLVNAHVQDARSRPVVADRPSATLRPSARPGNGYGTHRVSARGRVQDPESIIPFVSEKKGAVLQQF